MIGNCTHKSTRKNSMRWNILHTVTKTPYFWLFLWRPTSVSILPSSSVQPSVFWMPVQQKQESFAEKQGDESRHCARAHISLCFICTSSRQATSVALEIQICSLASNVRRPSRFPSLCEEYLGHFKEKATGCTVVMTVNEKSIDVSSVFSATKEWTNNIQW